MTITRCCSPFLPSPWRVRVCAKLSIIILLSAGKAALAAIGEPELTGEFALETWTTEHGIPQNSITALLQTRGGYIWASTYNGIAQFDGARFKVFDSANTKGLPNSRITSLFEDAQGDIWIGHDTGDLTRYSQGVFQNIPLGDAWPRTTICGIGLDVHGDLWVLSIRGEAIRVRDRRLITPLPEMVEDLSVMPQLAVDVQRRLLVIRNGLIGELTPEGYHKLNFQGDETRPYYSRVAPTPDGGLWVAGTERVRKWAGDKWQKDLGLYPWEGAFVVTMMETSLGQLLVGTLDRGLFIYDDALGWRNISRTNGLPQDWIRCLAEDREHNLWVGTSGGLVVMRPRKVVMRSPPDDWQSRPVQAITQAHDGAVWAATEGAGLYRLDSNSWTHFDFNSGLSNQFVWSVMEDSAGQIWAGTWGGGLFRREGEKFVRQFDLAERGEPVTALAEFPAGAIWIGTASGLIRWSNNQLERFASRGGAAAGDVRALAVGTDGELWIGTQGSGLGRFKDGKLQTFRATEGLPRDFVLSLLQEADGTLWIGTLDQGVCRYRNGRFVSITTSQGLPSNVIGHIEDDHLGNLWFSSQKGLFRISKKDLNDCADRKTSTLPVLIFGKAEGMTTLACSSGFTPSGFRAPNGDLWFPTARGIAVANPKSVRRNMVPPPVWIEEILVDGEPGEIKPSPARLANKQSIIRRVEVQPGRRQLDVQFTGLSFTSPERVQFKYRLEGGGETDWINGGTRRRVTYSFLPPGEYVFRVIACNSDGLWNETGDALTIVVLPFFWQTVWFKIGLVVMGFVAVGSIAFRVSRQRMRHKLERVARESELERERARIAQDIHDDLGASLTRIGMLSQSAAGNLSHNPPRAAVNLNQIYTTARELTRAMDEIVWAVNPRHDSLESLTNYITRFAQDFLGAAQIRCRLDVPLRVPAMTVRSEVRHNLFLAFKESLNNIVKHANATEVRITMQLTATGLNLSVVDNGSGFDPGAVSASRAGGRTDSGNGLMNIRSRLEQIGGRCVIHSAPGEETRVELFVPLSNVSLELTTTRPD